MKNMLYLNMIPGELFAYFATVLSHRTMNHMNLSTPTRVHLLHEKNFELSWFCRKLYAESNEKTAAL